MLLTNPIIYRGHPVEYSDLKNNSKIPLIFECEACHKPFKTTKYQVTRNGHEYCQACAIKIKLEKPLPVGNLYGRLTVVGQGEASGYSVCKCECGNTITVNNYNLESGHTRSCGCLQKEAASKTIGNLHLKGDKHPRWKGGIASEWSTMTRTKEYLEFRDAVLARDGFRCRKCGSAENLCVHHMYSFSSYPSERMNKSNAVCLCKHCHEQFHRLYGKKHNTRPQTLEYLS